MAGHRPQSRDGVIAEVGLPCWRYVAGRGLHGPIRQVPHVPTRCAGRGAAGCKGGGA